MILKQLGGILQNKAMGQKWLLNQFLKMLKRHSWSDSTSADGITKVTNYTLKEINGDNAYHFNCRYNKQ